MKVVKAIAANAFTYRTGFGQLPIVDVNPGGKRPKFKPLYYSPKLFGLSEELEVFLDGPFAIYKPPVVEEKKKKRKKRK